MNCDGNIQYWNKASFGDYIWLTELQEDSFVNEHAEYVHDIIL